MKLAFVFATSMLVTTLAQAQSVSTGIEATLRGGLVVQLGASDTQQAIELSKTGRYLVHVLDSDATKIASAQSAIHAGGRYGLAWAEVHREQKRLTYAENVVNMIVVRDYTAPLAELRRVLTPGGSIVVHNTDAISQDDLEAGGFTQIEDRNETLVATNPWPDEMDVWSHPRHAADGNAVSQDRLVGPPERVRWVAAATSEVEGMVTAGGRNFYGGILARDSFNGLRLWHRSLRKKGQNNPAKFDLPRLSRDGARPVASEKVLFAVLGKTPVAMDAATGKVLVEFGNMGLPTYVIHDGERVLATDTNSVRAFSVETGEQLWKVDASDPKNLIADGKRVSFIHGRVRRGEKAQAVVVNGEDGKQLWAEKTFPWIARTVRTVLAKDLLVFEVSTLNDHDADNGIHVVVADTGKHLWSRNYPPGMNHTRQARAMFLGDDLWILHGGKVNTADKSKMERQKVQVSALDPRTGRTRVTYPAGLAHCFPPVATPKYMFAGELDMTDLTSGQVVANRITKANCSRENGWVPANGLVYTTPKHCTCWPMLRGYVAMAPASIEESPANKPVAELEFIVERGTAKPDRNAPNPKAGDWPLYRHDRWRSGSSTTPGPEGLQERWTTAFKQKDDFKEPTGPILHDWADNPVVKGPLSPPTIANGVAYVTRPNAHELLAIDTNSGDVKWRFTANGRLDTPPAIHRGLCLFGTAAGWVYCLQATDGELVWRMRAAPSDERIVAYGQVESPWPVPGAVLVMDDIAYFAAGRQPLADGGILVFAVDPFTAKRHWVQRIDSVPQKGFYENSGLEFDPFDILHAEGDGLAMSRWILSGDGKDVSVDKWNAFAKLNTGAGEVWIPRGAWTYGARHQDRFRGEAPRRPLVVFKDDNVYSSINGTTDVFRKDFDLDKGEKFNSKWITGWKAAQEGNKGGRPFRTARIAEAAKWTNDPFAKPDEEKKKRKPGQQLSNDVHAMALGSNGKLYVVHNDGRMKVIGTEDGYVINETRVPEPAWDGLAIADGRLYLTTKAGELLCLGDE